MAGRIRFNGFLAILDRVEQLGIALGFAGFLIFSVVDRDHRHVCFSLAFGSLM